MPDFTFNWTLERDEETIECEVTYSCTPFIPAQTYGPAEHCHPAEGGEIEIISVIAGGKEIELTEVEMMGLHDCAEERAEQDFKDAGDDYGDYLADLARDRDD